MVRYFYAWMPFFVVAGTITFLTIPYLALAVLTIVTFLGLVRLARAVVAASYALGRTIARHRRARMSARPRATAALSPAGRQHA